MDISRLERESHELLEQLADRFPEDQLRMCRELDEVNERDELVDLMSAVLVKRAITVTPAERDALAALLYLYPIPVEGYKYISNRDQTLADLTVTE